MIELNKVFQSGQVLEASELNLITAKIDEIIKFINEGRLEQLASYGILLDEENNILYISGHAYQLNEIKVIESVSTVYDVPQISLTYPKIPYTGGTVYPVLSYSQLATTTTKYTDGSIETTTETITMGGDVQYFGTNPDGSVSASATSSTSDIPIASVYVNVSLNGKSGTSGVVVVYQQAKQVNTYYGYIPSSITGFSSKAESLLSGITSDMVSQAIAAEYLKIYVDPEGCGCEGYTVVTEGSYGYFYAIVPVKETGSFKQFDGISQFVPFSGDTGYYANGEVTITINGDEFKVYAQYAPATGTEFYVKLTDSSVEPRIILSETRWEPSAAPSNKVIYIETQGDTGALAYSSDSPFLTYNVVEGGIQLIVSENTTSATRVGILTVNSANGQTANVVVEQAVESAFVYYGATETIPTTADQLITGDSLRVTPVTIELVNAKSLWVAIPSSFKVESWIETLLNTLVSYSTGATINKNNTGYVLYYVSTPAIQTTANRITITRNN